MYWAVAETPKSLAPIMTGEVLASGWRQILEEVSVDRPRIGR
jgi:hypothetical protein